ncbi:MAG: 2Fe-2S iron-sulfur cluster-binding protein [Novosphingobium sp.]|nr:2Fe-2S iron-sulfur cluster-binding protein [Novosphingobium sp.]
MTHITVISRDGGEHRLDAPDGESVMSAIRDAGLDELLALCGGSCSCATCHCIVDAAWTGRIGPADGDEADLLEGSSSNSPASRLSCQITVSPDLDGLRVTIAPED